MEEGEEEEYGGVLSREAAFLSWQRCTHKKTERERECVCVCGGGGETKTKSVDERERERTLSMLRSGQARAYGRIPILLKRGARFCGMEKGVTLRRSGPGQAKPTRRTPAVILQGGGFRWWCAVV